MPTKAELEGWEPVNKELTTVAGVSHIPQFDLCRLNVVQLAEDIARQLSQPAPRSWFFKWHGNKKLQLDRERLSQVNDLVQSAILTHRNLQELQADLFLSQRTVEYLISRKLAEAQRETELALETHFTAIRLQLHTRNRMELIELKEKAEINLMNSHTRKMNAEAKQAEARAELMFKVVNSPKFDDLPDALYSFVVASIFNPNPTAFHDFAIQDELKQFIMQEKEADVSKARSGASVADSQARTARANADKTVRQLRQYGEE